MIVILACWDTEDTEAEGLQIQAPAETLIVSNIIEKIKLNIGDVAA